jgi:hypothetical protein
MKRTKREKVNGRPHGFRAMARTIMVERMNVHPDVIEAQLAHEKSGPLGAAYDRAEFMEQRRHMMTAWADYLEELRLRPAAVAKRYEQPAAASAGQKVPAVRATKRRAVLASPAVTS